jgi:glycosyltransferase involved in cell wall biosynthesis
VPPSPGSRRLLLVAQPLEAGVPNHVRDLLPAVLDAGFQVDVACPPTSVLWNTAGSFPGVGRHPISAARAPSPADARSLARLVPLVRQADVTHAHSSKGGLLARLAARATGRVDRCVFTPHGWSFWAYPAFLPVERVAAHWCRTIVAVSHHERDAALDARIGRRDQYDVIPNGVDVDRFAASVPPTGDDADRLVMVARLAPPRRHDIVLRALAVVRQQRPSVTLELVGEGPRRAQLEALARGLGIADAVTFSGDRRDVPDRLRGAAVVVQASDYEGSSLAVLEAMATSRAVVASAIGGMDELVVAGATGELCGSDPLDWAAAIGRALDARVPYGAAGRHRVEQRFSLRRMTAMTLELYERVLTNSEEAAQLITETGR